MDTNIAAWMIAGGPQIETLADQRDRENLRAFRESQRTTEPERVGLFERIRHLAAPKPAPQLDCCTV